jgi:predicted transcriptional regulator
MNRSVISIDSEASVKDAVSKMVQHQVGSLIVTDMGRPVGIVTETDMLSRVLALARNPESTKVETVMSKPLICGSPQMDFMEAARLMVNRMIKKRPITHHEELVGILTLTDVARVHQVMHEFIEAEAKGEPCKFHEESAEEIVEDFIST